MTDCATLQIRLADPSADKAALGVLFAELARHSLPNHASSTGPTSEIVAAQLAMHAGCEVLIAITDGVPCGLATFSTLFPVRGLEAALFVRDLFVIERFRSRGIGERLLRAVAALALKRGCKRVDWTAEATNEAALALYDRLGGQRLGQKVYYRVEADALAAFSNDADIVDCVQQTAPRILETERTIMRPHCREDLDDVTAMWAEPAVVRHISGVPSTASDSWMRLLRYIGHWPALHYGYWAVTDKSTGEFLGEVGFADFKREIDPSLDGLPEIGWVLKPSAHGRGLASEAVAAASAWGDRYLSRERTFCIIDPDHAASIRVATKNGYSEHLHTSYQGEPALILDRHRPFQANCDG